MIRAYWQIGRLIVEDEQQGEQRAEYGKKVLEELSERLTAEFGKGFTVTNLKYMRSFYRAFPIGHALRDELSWTHYRLLYEEKYRNSDDNPTLGIVLCSKRNEAIVKYSVLNESQQLFASKYLLYLPSKEELKTEIERERKLLDTKE